MKYLLSCIIILLVQNHASAEEFISMSKYLGITNIDEILIETVDISTNAKTYSSISEKKVLDEIKIKMLNLNSDGSVWKSMVVTRSDKVIIFHDDTKCSYFFMYNKMIRSLASKNGSFGIGDGESDLVNLIVSTAGN